MSESNWRSRLIVGSALSAAAIAVVVDHTRHSLPQPVIEQPSVPAGQQDAVIIVVEGDDGGVGSPCALDASPCALDASPCALDASPCSL